MPRHSKNRTSSPVVSSAERTALGYGSKKQRLNGESFLNVDSCVLCLGRARNARICEKGHLYCHECILSSLLAQKNDIKRHQVLIEKMKQQEESERAIARDAARQRVLTDFEKTQAVGRNAIVSAAGGSSKGMSGEGERGVKRKFEMDGDQVEKLVAESEERALKQLEVEQAEARKSKLPSFWLPSLTPDSGPSKLMEEPKLSTLCKASDPPHSVTLKSLMEVKFAADDTNAKADAPYICWTCRKPLTNNGKTFVLNPCGHVLCNTCVDSLCKKEEKCANCDTAVKGLKGQPKSSGFIEIKREGTGYASGGQAEAKRFEVAFQ